MVVRLTDDLVARVVVDRNGPRQGMDWFSREIAVAQFLAERGAPVIPVHPLIPPGPHEHAGYVMNFWRFVQAVDQEPDAAEVGRTLAECHRHLSEFTGDWPHLAILHETRSLMESSKAEPCWSGQEHALLVRHLDAAIAVLSSAPRQVLHGDAHFGNLLPTEDGLLWTDWEDTFSGPIEWDLASILWNPQFLDADTATVEAIRDGYGEVDEAVLETCFTARAAVMSAWYPVLYPLPHAERMEKLRRRLEWLSAR
nr:aminoglycoside phosphotransferase family protein [Haloferula luteola]